MKLKNVKSTFMLKDGVTNPFGEELLDYEITVEVSTVIFTKGERVIIIPLENFEYLSMECKDEDISL